MAAEIINGQAVLHGIQTNGTPITISGYASFILDSLSGSHEFEKYMVKDGLGNDASAVAFNETFPVVIDWTPAGTTRAGAAATITVPIPLAKVTLSNCKATGTFGSTAAPLFNGDYMYDGGTKIEFKQGVAAKLTGLKLMKWADTTQNASLTTTVVG